MDDVQEKQMLFKFLPISRVIIIGFSLALMGEGFSEPKIKDLTNELEERSSKVEIKTDTKKDKLTLNRLIGNLKLKSDKININVNNSYKINKSLIESMSSEAVKRADVYFNTNELTVFDEKIKGLKKSKLVKTNDGNRLYIFISKSVPIDTIRRYVLDAYKIKKFTNVSILLSGGIDSNRSIKPTIQFVYDVSKKNKECKGVRCPRYNIDVLIDPVIFNRYGINKVPAFVVADLANIKSYCSEGSSEITVKEYAVVYGDGTITKALEYFSEHNNLYSKQLLEKVKDVIW